MLSIGDYYPSVSYLSKLLFACYDFALSISSLLAAGILVFTSNPYFFSNLSSSLLNSESFLPTLAGDDKQLKFSGIVLQINSTLGKKTPSGEFFDEFKLSESLSSESESCSGKGIKNSGYVLLFSSGSLGKTVPVEDKRVSISGV